MPKISVIVPCFNQAQYLDECLQSVLDQTFQDWECIIVDDGSPDNTAEIAAKWIEKDNRFKYFEKENEGVAKARNYGIELSNGEWILPLDGDDKLNNEYLERAANEFSKDFTLIYCKANFFGTIERAWHLPKFSYEELLLNNSIFCSAFFKKKAWLEINGYDPGLIYGFEDWEFWIRLLSRPNTKVHLIDYTGFYYRRKHSSRDTVINNDAQKMADTETYIYNKHQKLYIDTFGSPIKNLRDQRHLREENMALKTKLNNIGERLHKNRVLRVIIKILSGI